MARPGFELTINQSKTNAMALSIGPQSCSINNTKLWDYEEQKEQKVEWIGGIEFC